MTVHLDTFDRVSPCGYAVIVIDKTATRWVCCSQCGLHMPPAGVARQVNGHTELRASANESLICVLESLDLASPSGPFEGETGRALWYGEQAIQPAPGHWHIELIAEDADAAEQDAVQDGHV